MGLYSPMGQEATEISLAIGGRLLLEMGKSEGSLGGSAV